MAHRLPLADIQFIADFSAFCRTKGDEAYDYVDNEDCACAQFLKATGRASAPCVAEKWEDDAGNSYLLPAGVDRAASNKGASFNKNGWTFSALADRLEALIADAPAVAKAPA